MKMLPACTAIKLQSIFELFLFNEYTFINSVLVILSKKIKNDAIGLGIYTYVCL